MDVGRGGQLACHAVTLTWRRRRHLWPRFYQSASRLSLVAQPQQLTHSLRSRAHLGRAGNIGVRATQPPSRTRALHAKSPTMENVRARSQLSVKTIDVKRFLFWSRFYFFNVFLWFFCCTSNIEDFTASLKQRQFLQN